MADFINSFTSGDLLIYGGISMLAGLAMLSLVVGRWFAGNPVP